jgi:hypothetical protein
MSSVKRIELSNAAIVNLLRRSSSGKSFAKVNLLLANNAKIMKRTLENSTSAEELRPLAQMQGFSVPSGRTSRSCFLRGRTPV